jgi:hypothetical protein
MSAGPIKSRDRIAHVVRFNPGELKEAASHVEGFNAKVALIITRSVGTMACAYLFTLLAFAGLPAALHPGGEGIVAWIAQTFLQLVLLSIIMVGQSVQSSVSDARAQKEFEDTETILDRLDAHTAGGLRDVLDAIAALAATSGVAAAAGVPAAPGVTSVPGAKAAPGPGSTAPGEDKT